MNAERLTAIAEWLEAGAPERDGVAGFDMRDFIDRRSCGTYCCIAGAAVAMFEPSLFLNNNPYTGDTLATEILDLDEDTADALFYALGASTDAMDWSPAVVADDAAWAARCVRKLIATGKVDWPGTREVP